MKQVRIDITIGELVGIRNKLNMNPAYQRDYIAGENVIWQKKLIQNLMRGEICLPSLYVRVNSSFQQLKGIEEGNIPENDRKLIISHLIEMIDGQQRTRTIYDFIDDIFSLGNMILYSVDEYGDPESIELENPTASDMLVDIEMKPFYEKFLNKKISIVATLGNDRDVHQMFLDLNDLNNMSNQEKRNAIHSYIAKWVRDNSRRKPHKLFKRDCDRKGIYLPFSFKKMNQDEMLSKIFAIVDGIGFNSGLGKSNLDKLYRMVDYSANSKSMKQKSKRVLKIVDRIYDIVEDGTYKRMLQGGCFINLVMVVNEYLEDNSIKVTDWKLVRDWFFNTHNMLTDIKHPYNENKMSGDSETTFSRKTRMMTDKEGMYIRLTELKRNGMYSNGGVLLVDGKRVISDKEFEGVWFIYNKKCAKCGEDVKLHEAVKGHIKAHQRGLDYGGESTVENTVPLHKSCNAPQVEDQEIKVYEPK